MDFLTDNGNNIWGTLERVATDALKTGRDVKLAKISADANVKTQAAPSGTPYFSNFNPFPGLFSSFPQADAKAGAAPVYAGTQFNPAWLILGALLLVGLIFSRR